MGIETIRRETRRQARVVVELGELELGLKVGLGIRMEGWGEMIETGSR